MENMILGTEIPCGHPFTPEQVKSIFNVKSNTNRWRKSSELKKVFSRSKNSQISDDVILSLKSIKRCGSDATNMILTLPFLRKSALKGWQDHWPDTAAPELYAINAFCKKYYQKPYFCINGDCLRRDILEDGVTTIENRELMAAAAYFSQTLKRGILDVSPLITTIFAKIDTDPDSRLAHNALWAICSAYDCSLPIQYILHKNPDLQRFYDFLDWYVINDVFEDEDCITDVKTEYREDANFYYHFPQALHSGFVDETIRSHTENLLCDSAKRLFMDDVESIHHSHHKISDYSDIISSVRRTQNALELYFDTFFDDIASNTIKAIDKYIEDRELCAQKFKDTTGEDKLPKIDLSNYEKTKRELFTTSINRSAVILRFERVEFKSAIEDLRNSLVEPFQALHILSSKYTELSSDPIKNRKALTDLLEEIDQQVERSITEIKESDELFMLLIDKIGKMISNLQKDKFDSNEDKIAELQQRLEDSETNLYEKTCTIEKLNNKLEKANAEQAQKQHTKAEPVEVKVEETKAISALIRDANITPATVLKVITELYPNNVVVLQSAYDSAKEVEGFRQTHKMFDLLNTLVTRYLPSIVSGNADTEARKCFGVKAYAANESKTVSSSQKLMHYRQFKIGDKQVEMQQHLNIGIAHDQLQTMRIYFKIIDNKVYIGYAGKHLPNK